VALGAGCSPRFAGVRAYVAQHAVGATIYQGTLLNKEAQSTGHANEWSLFVFSLPQQGTATTRLRSIPRQGVGEEL